MKNGSLVTSLLFTLGCSQSPVDHSTEQTEGQSPRWATSQSFLSEAETATLWEAADWHGYAEVDEEGRVISHRIELDASETLVGPADGHTAAKESPTVPPPPVVNPIVTSRAEAAPNASQTVLISVRHSAPFTRLTPIDLRLPRSAVENQRRIEARASEIATVELLRAPSRASVAQFIRSRGGRVLGELTFGNSVVASIPNALVSELALRVDVLHIGPEVIHAPPPVALQAGRTALSSDAWYNLGYAGSPGVFVSLFDTGVRSSHTVFTLAGLDLHGDCSHGNDDCQNSPPNPLFNDQDAVGHGTGSANIIMGAVSLAQGFGSAMRGVSAAWLDYYAVFKNTDGEYSHDATAWGRASERATLYFTSVVVGEVQFAMGENSDVSLAADDLYDAGITVVAATGNQGQVSTDEPAAPCNAHKVLCVGDYDAVTGVTHFQYSGKPGGRQKPDIQGPTSVDAAGNASNTAKNALQRDQWGHGVCRGRDGYCVAVV